MQESEDCSLLDLIMHRSGSRDLPTRASAASVALFSALLIFLTFSPIFTSDASSCCPEDQPPISDCSFYYMHNSSKKRHVRCEVIQGSKSGYLNGYCPNTTFENADEIPGKVVNLKYSFFITSCAPTINWNYPLVASTCHSLCTGSAATLYYGISITFQIDGFTADNTKGIMVHLSEGTNAVIWCGELRFTGRRPLGFNAAEHTFSYDGVIGLRPDTVYRLTAYPNPTNAYLTNQQYLEVFVPRETCWKPDLEHHNTPFAVNFTLFQDNLYNFSRFSIFLGEDFKNGKTVNFDTTNLYILNGKMGTIVTFECLAPREYKLEIWPTDCPSCEVYTTHVSVKAAPPLVTNCQQDILRVEKPCTHGKVTNVEWGEPRFEFSCGARKGKAEITPSAYRPGSNSFEVNKPTNVTYHASQHGEVAECKFVVIATCASAPPSTAFLVGSIAGAVLVVAVVVVFVVVKKCHPGTSCPCPPDKPSSHENTAEEVALTSLGIEWQPVNQQDIQLWRLHGAPTPSVTASSVNRTEAGDDDRQNHDVNTDSGLGPGFTAIPSGSYVHDAQTSAGRDDEFDSGCALLESHQTAIATTSV